MGVSFDSYMMAVLSVDSLVGVHFATDVQVGASAMPPVRVQAWQFEVQDETSVVILAGLDGAAV